MAKFTNFGRLYLKKIHSCWNFLFFYFKVLVMSVVHAKDEKISYVGTFLNLGPKMGLKKGGFPHLP